MTNSAFRNPSQVTRIAVHALHVGDRIHTAGFEKEALSAVPLALRAGGDGIAVLFRYGAVVFLNMTMEEEAAFLDRLLPRIGGRLTPPEEESATVELLGESEDQVGPGGPIHVRDMSMARLLVVSDVLAKSVVLAHDERDVTKVFETIEPFVRELASSGKFFRNRRGILRLIGEALLVQHNVSGRVAITDKPDALWDRPDLERLYARLEDEYELIGRVETLNRKLAVVADTADTLADIIDTRRSLRLEIIVVLLIGFEIVIGFWQIFLARGGH
jgi:required for meiotic nuclear division protein 1